MRGIVTASLVVAVMALAGCTRRAQAAVRGAHRDAERVGLRLLGCC